MEFKGLHVVRSENKGELIFFGLLSVLILLCVFLFRPIMLQVNSTIFIVVINSILIAFASKLINKTLKNEVYKLIVIGFNLLLLELLFQEKKSMIFFMFNFYSIMYGVLFIFYFKRFSILISEIRSYVYFVNCFLFLYFLLINIELIFLHFFNGKYTNQLSYLYIGIKCILLFISVLTLFQGVTNQLIRKDKS